MSVIIDKKEFSIFKTMDEITEASKSLAKKIDEKFLGKGNFVWITIMNGGIMFSTELMKYVKTPLELDYIFSSSYLGYEQAGEPKVKYESSIDLEGKNIILVDDLIDSGKTIIEINKTLSEFKPKSITNVAMFGKSNRLKSDNEEMFAFEDSPNGFLAGFGLDINGLYRNLPYVAIIKEEDKK